jgi:hypothetical protein
MSDTVDLYGYPVSGPTRRVGVIGASRLDYRQVAPYRDPTAWLGM